MTTATSYQVGQRIVHPRFGVGLIVEVRHGRGSDVLEVVFGTELKRLSARIAWEPAGDGAEGSPAPGASQPEPTLAGEADGDGDGEADAATLEEAEEEAARAIREASQGSIWHTDETTAALVERWVGGGTGEPGLFTAGYRAERCPAGPGPTG